MTAYSSTCEQCRQHCDWIICPTGGWWAHREHPVDNHDAVIDWQPPEHMDDQGEWVTA
jgi:hypothetical protein